MPFEANAMHRHHIPKQRRRVTNWPEYDASLRGRGSLTVWFTEEAIAAWQARPRLTRGGQPLYSGLARYATSLLAPTDGYTQPQEQSNKGQYGNGNG